MNVAAVKRFAAREWLYVVGVATATAIATLAYGAWQQSVSCRALLTEVQEGPEQWLDDSADIPGSPACSGLWQREIARRGWTADYTDARINDANSATVHFVAVRWIATEPDANGLTAKPEARVIAGKQVQLAKRSRWVQPPWSWSVFLAELMTGLMIAPFIYAAVLLVRVTYAAWRLARSDHAS